MTGRRSKKAHAGIDRAALGIGRAVIEPPDPCERDRAGAHRAGLQREVEVAIDQSPGADGLGGLPERQYFGIGGRIAVGQRPAVARVDVLVNATNLALELDLARLSAIL